MESDEKIEFLKMNFEDFKKVNLNSEIFQKEKNIYNKLILIDRFIFDERDMIIISLFNETFDSVSRYFIYKGLDYYYNFFRRKSI